MKVYAAYSTADEYRKFRNVLFHWFAHREVPLVSPEEAILDYHELSERQQAYALGYVSELLTENEVEELRAYLQKEHKAELETVEVELPIQREDATDLMPWEAIAVGGMDDFYMLSREEAYNLSVPIWGYFDLRAAGYGEREERIAPVSENLDVHTLPSADPPRVIIVASGIDGDEDTTITLFAEELRPLVAALVDAAVDLASL